MSNTDTTQMVRYLLGDISEQEQIRLEERFFTDEDAYQQLQAIEDELRYDYAQGALSSRDRKLFEQRYLQTPADRDRVQLAKSVLNKTLETAAQFAPSTEPKVPWWRRLMILPPVTQFAGATALLAVIGTLGLLVQTSRLKNELNGLEQKQRTSQTAMADLDKQLQQERQRRQELEKQSAPGSSRTPNFMAFMLIPGLSRDAEGPKRLSVPAGVDFVRLQMEVKPPQSLATYRASLQNLDGVELWSQQLTGTSTSATLTIPGRLFRPGDYMVELKTAGPGESVRAGEYYFSIVK